MKKIVFYVIFIFCFSLVNIYADSSFSIDTTKILNNDLNKASRINKDINNKLSFDFKDITEDNEHQKLIDLSKKITYLLLYYNKNETPEDYYKRYKTYMNMMYKSADKITTTNLEYNNLTTNFKNLEQLKIKYNFIETIEIDKHDDGYLSKVTIKNISFVNNDIEKKGDLNLYYYLKKQDNEYKIYYLTYETSLEVLNYLYDLRKNEKEYSVISSYNSKLKEFDKYKNITYIDENISNRIAANNIDNMVVLSSYYDGSLIKQANGFFITKDLIMTTWSFLEDSLINAQNLIVSNTNGSLYDIDSIIQIVDEKNIAIIKLKTTNHSFVTLENNYQSNTKAIIMTSFSGTGLTVIPSFITNINEEICLFGPVMANSEGSPIFNSSGKVIGMVNSDNYNSSLINAISSETLSIIYSKLNTTNISGISFEDLKAKYYYTSIYEEAKSNNIPSKKWLQYSKIGNIENTIKLELIKASYKDEIVALKYYNSSFKYINSIYFANDFIDNLGNDEFVQVYKDNNKYIYENLNYKIIIFSDYEYLFVVMVKK